MKNNLKQFRLEADLTMTELADASGMTSAGIHKLEHGATSPYLLSAYAVAKVLDKSVYDIWPDETEVKEVETITVRRIIAQND